MVQNTPKTNAKHKKRPQKTSQYKQPNILSLWARAVSKSTSPSKRPRIPELKIVDERRMKNPHLRKCVYCFEPIRTQNLKAHVEKHIRNGDKPRPDEARRQFDESLANAKQYIQKNKAAFSNTTHEPVPVPVLLPPVGQVQRDKTQSDVKTSRKKNVPNGRRNKKYVVFELVGKYEHEIAIRIQSQFFRLSIEHFTYAPC